MGDSSPYLPRDRAGLAALDARLRAYDPDLRAAARQAAGLLRQQLPDIDDTTIGQVLIALAGKPSTLLAAHITSRQQHPSARTAVAQLWAALAGAALDLTAPDWQPRHDSRAEPGQNS